VPPPGDDRRLAETVARIFARPLDRSRPLDPLVAMIPVSVRGKDEVGTFGNRTRR
jgi:hypothetical protein